MEEIVFPNQLRMLRRLRGRRMVELANLLDLTISALSKIENGYRRLNEEQLQKVAKFLDCPYEALFVSEKSSQPEVLQAWQEEQKNRRQKNTGSGLRVLGAGLRYIRGQKKMSLMSVAKGANLTLSVYHRIEMGQREVDEKTFENISRALGLSGADLQLKIYELDTSGVLDDLKNNTGKRGIGLFKGGYNDLPVSRLTLRTGISKEISVPIMAQLQADGIVRMQSASVGNVVVPSTLANDPKLYAVQMADDCQITGLPKGAVLIISPTMPVRLSDWGIFENQLVRVVAQKDAEMCVQPFTSKDEYIAGMDALQRVVWIALI